MIGKSLLLNHSPSEWFSLYKKATSRKAWQFGSDFGKLHSEFPSLVEENGSGWFHRHVHRVETFVRENPEKVSSSARKKCAAIETGFDRACGTR